jgi:hypothetical protein
MAIVVPIFVVPDIKRMVHYVQKRILAKKAVKVRRGVSFRVHNITLKNVVQSFKTA